MTPPRPDGFLGECCPANYDDSSDEHSFIYALLEYFTNLRIGPVNYRSLIQTDIAAGSTLLSQKYYWIGTNIFHGIDFQGDNVVRFQQAGFGWFELVLLFGDG